MADAGRVITGIAGGIRLLAPGEGTRPIADRVKQSLFAALDAELEGVWGVPALDLFAGSGACGIEALSRGASRAVFVEEDARAAAVIAENLERTRLSAAGSVVRRDALRWLAAGAAAAGEGRDRFGVVVVDPPYQAGAALAEALDRLGDPSLGWLRPDAIVIAKHFWRSTPPDATGVLRAVRDRRFGETALRHYRPRQPEQEEPVAR